MPVSQKPICFQAHYSSFFWFTIIQNTDSSRHFPVSTSARLIETLAGRSGTFVWPCSLQAIRTAAGCLVFCPPQFSCLHPSPVLHWPPVFARFWFEIWWTRLRMVARPCPSRPWFFQTLHAACSTYVICWVLLIPWVLNILPPGSEKYWNDLPTSARAKEQLDWRWKLISISPTSSRWHTSFSTCLFLCNHQ